MHMKKPYPTKEELNKLWWYKGGKFLKWIIVIFAFFSPLMSEKPAQGAWFIDSIIGAVLWFLILSGIGFAVMRIMYQKPLKKTDVQTNPKQ